MRADRPGVLPNTGTAGARAEDVVELGDLGTWRPKLVASDLDGTLLTSDGKVSARTRAALTACWDAGIPVVGVTGRGPRLFDSVRAALDGRGIAVLAQGGFVVDLERDEVLRTVGLPREQATAVIERIESVAGELVLAVEDAAEQGEVHSPLRVQHGFDWPYPEPAHLLPRIEVLPPGITKATGLAIALERYGVGFGDVLVFGDMPNDLPMIEAVRDAGGRAVAVANAHPAVRGATPLLTSGHDVDGVARYLEALL